MSSNFVSEKIGELQSELTQAKSKINALENDLVNANGNLELMTENTNR